MKKLLRFAQNIYQTPEDIKAFARSRNWFLLIILGSILIPAFAINVAFLGLQFKERSSFNLSAPLDIENWHVFYNNSSQSAPANSLCNPSKITEECPASPQSSLLWKSPLSRKDEDYRKRLSLHKGKEYWIGTIISPDTQRTAFEKKANHMVLGHFYGAYEIWIDGALILSGQGNLASRQLAVPISMNRLVEHTPMYVAIKILHNMDSPLPDVFTFSYRMNGFMTSSSFESFLRYDSFTRVLHKFILYSSYLILGFIFAITWSLNRKKQEFAFFALYALAYTAFYLPRDEFLYLLNISFGQTYPILLTTFFILGGAALLLGASFARIKRKFFLIMIPATLLVIPGSVLSVFLFIPSLKHGFLAMFAGFYTAAGYLTGAILCFLQFYALLPRTIEGNALRKRAQSLLLFGLGLTIIGIIEFPMISMFLSKDLKLIMPHLNLALVLTFLYLLLRNWYLESQMVSKMHVSPYHKRALLPEKVSGVMLNLDIKKSEYLFRFKGLETNGNDLIHSCLSELWSVIDSYHGTVIHTEGDGFIAFFSTESSRNPIKQAVDACFSLKTSLTVFDQQLKDRGIYLLNVPSIEFRVAIESGDIKPIWQELEDYRYASWTGVGPHNPFIETRRLLEVSRSIDHDEHVSIVILTEETAKELDIFADKGMFIPFNWQIRAHVAYSKHDRSYNISAFLPYTQDNISPSMKKSS